MFCRVTCESITPWKTIVDLSVALVKNQDFSWDDNFTCCPTKHVIFFISRRYMYNYMIITKRHAISCISVLFHKYTYFQFAYGKLNNFISKLDRAWVKDIIQYFVIFITNWWKIPCLIKPQDKRGEKSINFKLMSKQCS